MRLVNTLEILVVVAALIYIGFDIVSYVIG